MGVGTGPVPRLVELQPSLRAHERLSDPAPVVLDVPMGRPHRPGAQGARATVLARQRR
ncbi:hypothetical protein [Kitasatospora sp. NPDC017646]|uniref:hypothetical protein n=1 Tax=Kitasatospora sp. NPDC017646 TaxID=3364024 RepID=UPI003787445E